MNFYDYSGSAYGSPEAPMYRYIFFLHIEATHIGGFAVMDMHYYYRIIDNSILELILRSTVEDLDSKTRIIGKFELKEPFHLKILHHHVRQYIKHGRNWFSLGYKFHKSPIMSETQFKTLVDDIMADLMINKYHIEQKWKNSPIALLCEEFGFEIIPTPDHDHIIDCRCPTGYSHRMTLNLESGSWFCGRCGKNGYLKELKAHFEKYEGK